MGLIRAFTERPQRALGSAGLSHNAEIPAHGHSPAVFPVHSSPTARNAASRLIGRGEKKKSSQTFPRRLTFKSIATTDALNLTLDLLIQEIYSAREHTQKKASRGASDKRQSFSFPENNTRQIRAVHNVPSSSGAENYRARNASTPGRAARSHTVP